MNRGLHRPLAGLFAVLVFGFAPIRAEAVPEREQWFVGHLNGVPALRGREAIEQDAEGVVLSRFDLDLVLLRPARIEVRQSELFREDASGNLLGFTFDHDEGGRRTTAVGQLRDGSLEVTVYRLGRTYRQHLELPDDAPLVGQRLSQRMLADAPADPDSPLVFVLPQLVQAEVVLSRTTARWVEDPEPGLRTFTLTSDLIPLPVTTVVDRQGELRRMELSFGPFLLEMVPTDSPPTLLGAELPPTGLIESKGDPPSATGANRYRLPSELHPLLPQDGFQRLEQGVLTVSPESPSEPLPDPESYLGPTSQLELDDPELRSWALEIAKGSKQPAEALRLAVRSHIAEKDLSKGDASALEAFRDRRGDCTEHANLLAAALRIAGIPARIEIGFVWAPDYGGWVGHAWNSAYDDPMGRWMHLDAAYPGLSRGVYIKVAELSSLDAAGTGAVLGTVFARILGRRIETLPTLQETPP